MPDVGHRSGSPNFVKHDDNEENKPNFMTVFHNRELTLSKEE